MCLWACMEVSVSSLPLSFLPSFFHLSCPAPLPSSSPPDLTFLEHRTRHALRPHFGARLGAGRRGADLRPQPRLPSFSLTLCPLQSSFSFLIIHSLFIPRLFPGRIRSCFFSYSMLLPTIVLLLLPTFLIISLPAGQCQDN